MKDNGDKPSNVKNTSKPSNVKNTSKPSNVKNTSKPSNVKDTSKPSNVKNTTKPSNVKNTTKQSNVKNTWKNGLLDCCDECNIMCCFNHCCCSPCIWADSLRKAGVSNSTFYAIIAFICPEFSCCAYAQGRTELVQKYNIDESCFESYFIRCCCPVCSQIQEVNMVAKTENLKYGCVTMESKLPPVTENMKR